MQIFKGIKSSTIAFFLISSTLTFSLNSWAFPVKFGLSPDNSQDLLTQTLQSARKEIVLNVYQFDNPEISKVLIEKIQAGLTVRLLLEGSPIPKVSDAEKKTISAVVDAMHSVGNSANRLFVMKDYDGPKPGTQKRRFKYDHAKYIVIDNQTVLVTSENYTTTGHAAPGKVGNRGWEVVMENSDMAQQLTQIFESDVDTSFGDVQDIAQSIAAETQTPSIDTNEDRAKIRHTPAIEVASGDATSATLVTSPKAQDGITNFINSASESLDIEEMSYPLNWKGVQNPSVTALIDAARRGATVRVLLNDDNTFGHKPNGSANGPDEGDMGDSTSTKQTNQMTVNFLNQLAGSDGLKLEARIVNVSAVEITYIHNKGLIADGQRSFISSINGTQNSVMNNREVALNLDCAEGAAYYKTAFDFDWKQSAGNRSLEGIASNPLFQALQSLSIGF